MFFLKKKKKIIFMNLKKFNIKRLKVILLKKKNYFYLRIYGPFGYYDYKFFLPLIFLKNFFFFFSKKLLNFFNSFFKSSYRSLCFGFFAKFIFSGVGFRFWKLIKKQKNFKLINNNIYFLLGYSHFFEVKLPKNVYIYYKKPKFSFFSFYKYNFSFFKKVIENLRFPDPYKLKGIILKKKFYIKKQGKQR
jgi:ribosomal protein L6P/L9E